MGAIGPALPYILGGLGVVTSVMGAAGASQAGNAAAASDRYNAQVAANNAAIQRQNANYAAAEGEAKTAQAQMKTRAEVGAIKANQGASGVNVNTGSAVDVRSSASELGELNAITVRSNAARQAYGYQTEAANSDAQSQLDKSQAGFDKKAGNMKAISTLLGGLSSAAGNFAGGGGGGGGLDDGTDSFYGAADNLTSAAGAGSGAASIYSGSY